MKWSCFSNIFAAQLSCNLVGFMPPFGFDLCLRMRRKGGRLSSAV